MSDYDNSYNSLKFTLYITLYITCRTLEMEELSPRFTLLSILLEWG